MRKLLSFCVSEVVIVKWDSFPMKLMLLTAVCTSARVVNPIFLSVCSAEKHKKPDGAG